MERDAALGRKRRPSSIQRRNQQMAVRSWTKLLQEGINVLPKEASAHFEKG